MTSRVVRQREDSGTVSRAVRGPVPVGLGRYAQAPWLPCAPLVPTRPVACTWREVLRVCLGVFFGGEGGNGGAAASRGRHSQSQAEAHPQLSPAPRGATCSVRFGSAVTVWALFRSACAACKIWPRVFVASCPAVSTDDKFSAKWLLERVA